MARSRKPALVLDIDEASGLSVSEQIRNALTEQAIKVLDLFLDWDADHSGEVTKGEFRNEMSKLGLETHQTEVDALFDSWDPDRSGSLELKELERVLRRTTMLDKKLCAGAVELQLKKGNSKSLRASAADMSSFSSCFDLDEASDETFAVQLHRMLQDTSRDQGGRLADLFREWDTDESGQLSKPEFRLAMRKISYALPSEDIDHVFDSMDPDRSGTIDYKELHTLLRRARNSIGTKSPKERNKREAQAGATSPGAFAPRVASADGNVAGFAGGGAAGRRREKVASDVSEADALRMMLAAQERSRVLAQLSRSDIEAFAPLVPLCAFTAGETAAG